MTSEHRATLVVEATADPFAKVTIFDGELRPVPAEGGLGRAQALVPVGLYLVEFRSGDRVHTQQAIVRSRDKEVRVTQATPVGFSSAVPVPHLSAWQKGQGEPATAESRSPATPAFGGGTGHLFIFLRDEESSTEPPRTQGLSLHPIDGSSHFELAGASKEDPARRCAWSHLELPPATYRLRLVRRDDWAWEQGVVVRPGFQTQAFFLCRPASAEDPTRVADLRTMSVVMRPGQGFQPDDRFGRLTELALRAISTGDGLARLDPDVLLAAKFDNPMLGILGAHLLLRARSVQVDQLLEVLRNLFRAVGRHPDVEAVRLGLAQRLGEDPLAGTPGWEQVEPLRSVPMLRRSWKRWVQATRERPELIPPGSFADRIGLRAGALGPWLAWPVEPGSEEADPSEPPATEENLRELRRVLTSDAGARQRLEKEALPPLQRQLLQWVAPELSSGLGAIARSNDSARQRVARMAPDAELRDPNFTEVFHVPQGTAGRAAARLLKALTQAHALKVFCSHRSVDKPRVLEVAAKLRAAGIDAWVDQWEIQPGDNIVQKVNEGLETFDVGLLFVSQAALDSAWVKEEVWAMLYRMIEEGKAIIPVLLEPDVKLPPMLATRCRIPAEDVPGLIDAILHRSKKPPLGPTTPPPGRERTFELRIRRVDAGTLGVTATEDGQAVAPEQVTRLDADFRFSYREFLEGEIAGSRASPGDGGARVAERAEALARLGASLGRILYPGPIGERLTRTLGTRGAGDRLVVSLEASEPDLLAIPLEAARLADGRNPALEPGVRTLRRHMPAGEATQVAPAPPRPGPLRILVAVAAPDEGQTPNVALDLEAELQTLIDAVGKARSLGNAVVEVLQVAQPKEIEKALREREYHVLHVSGHGAAGRIEMENEDGGSVQVTPEEMVNAFRGAGRMPALVVLSACHSGTGKGDTAGFAQGLVERGVPRVVAMQSRVSDWYATQLAGTFYELLSTIEAPLASVALARARQQLEAERTRLAVTGDRTARSQPEYATAALFCAGAEAPILDRSLPQTATPSVEAVRGLGPVPVLALGDLIGRRREVRRILRVLREDPKAVAEQGKKAGVQVCGMGGVGKSALAGRVMARWQEGGGVCAAIAGECTLGKLAQEVGAQLALDAPTPHNHLAQALAKPETPDAVRFEALRRLLQAHPVLVVLDNFEDNLVVGGGAYRQDVIAKLLGFLYGACGRGKVLLTTRYPVPGAEAWLAREDLGALSTAESWRLIQRLPALERQDLGTIQALLRAIGGHPRLLEYLDGILRGGVARLPAVTERLRRQAAELGLSLEAAPEKLQDAVVQALRVGASDILLDELLALVDGVAGDRAVLEQAAVFPSSVSVEGLADAVSDGKGASAEQVDALRVAARRLRDRSLVAWSGGQKLWVHRWTAGAVAERMQPSARAECRRRGGEYLLRRVRTESHSIDDGMEAVRLLLAAGAYDRAAKVACTILQALEAWGHAVDALAFAREVLAPLPPSGIYYLHIADAEASALHTLGDTRAAVRRYEELLAVAKEMAAATPERTEGERPVSVLYEKLGDLLRGLGQGEAAKRYHEQRLAIAERLARAEPDRADYQFDLAVSLVRIALLETPADAIQHVTAAHGVLTRLEAGGKLLPTQAPALRVVDEWLRTGKPPSSL
ncbi:MAG: CHAT domain-containing protein [Planctomycetes bacterium]|nr:CHAT domain-containing protein [Planctomycetota bacterium]